MADVLGACRESGTGEESISIANQKKRISQWADDRGHRVIYFTVDKDTSGGVPAAKREDLGPWLTQPAKIAQWEILATAKLDRGFRSVLDFAQTAEWADRCGKKLVSVTEGYDLTTPEGELMANQLVAFAQFERKRAGQRRSEAAEMMAEAGRWGGGRKPFGYKAIGNRGNWRLVKDEATVGLVLRMAGEVLDGKGFLTVAGEFNAEGIPSPWGKTWTGFTVKRILTSPAMIGYQTRTVEHRDTVVFRDSHGKPVKFTEDPILTEDEYRSLQDAIRMRARKRDMPQARLLLYHVFNCRYCDVPLKGYRRVKHRNKGSRYYCTRCPNGTSMHRLEEYVAGKVIGEYGKRKLLEQAVLSGDDHATEIARLQRRAERLRAELDEDYDADIAHAVKSAEEKIDELRSMPHEEDRTAWVPVVPEITVAEFWEASDDKGRNKFLRDYGFMWWLSKDGIEGRGAWVPPEEEIFQL